ncbi:MAG TPA: alanine dehydrogenase, partial [Saprospiraceae bacterium]|nr:alanine dehydrogenase [Saprospiraceae bacterium]
MDQIHGQKIKFDDFFTKGQFQIQEERLQVINSKKELTIGLPNDSGLTETRVPLVPNSIRSLIGCGYSVVVESGAGLKSNFSDRDFSEAGADIKYSRKEVLGAHFVIKMAPPSVEDLNDMPGNQTLLSPLHIPGLTKEVLEILAKKKIVALAMEYLKTDRGDFPVVRILSEIAGMYAIIKAGELLSSNVGSRGILLGGISGVPPAKIVILGAGVVGEYAAKTALGFGASLRIFDNDIHKIMRLQTNIGRQLHT